MKPANRPGAVEIALPQPLQARMRQHSGTGVEGDDNAEGSVTGWIKEVKRGDDDAAHRLFGRYSERVAQLALASLGNAPRGGAGEEDVVQEVFLCLMRGAAQGRFGQLHDREDLWQILLMLTERRAADQRRRERAHKRSAKRTRDEQAMAYLADESVRGLAAIVGGEPTPEDAAVIAENIRQRFSELDEELSRIALLKLEQHTIPQIAERLGLSVPTVERKLRRIRSIWGREE